MPYVSDITYRRPSLRPIPPFIKKLLGRDSNVVRASPSITLNQSTENMPVDSSSFAQLIKHEDSVRNHLSLTKRVRILYTGRINSSISLYCRFKCAAVPGKAKKCAKHWASYLKITDNLRFAKGFSIPLSVESECLDCMNLAIFDYSEITHRFQEHDGTIAIWMFTAPSHLEES